MPGMDTRTSGLTPPDLGELPALPGRFSWQLPHLKQHRQPTPAGRQIVVDGQGPAVASVQPGVQRVSILLGAHRPLHAEQHKREFVGDGARTTALRFAARWVELRAATILAEYERSRLFFRRY